MWVVPHGAAPPIYISSPGIELRNFAITNNLEKYTAALQVNTRVAMDRFDIIKTPKVSGVFPELRSNHRSFLERDIHSLVYDSPS